VAVVLSPVLVTPGINRNTESFIYQFGTCHWSGQFLPAFSKCRIDVWPSGCGDKYLPQRSSLIIICGSDHRRHHGGPNRDQVKRKRLFCCRLLLATLICRPSATQRVWWLSQTDRFYLWRSLELNIGDLHEHCRRPWRWHSQC